MRTDKLDITGLLQQVEEGNRQALDRLYEAVYQQLRQIAAAHRSAWQGDETLNTTALVHEAYLKLVRQENPGWENRRHFFAVASRAMRHILVDHAKRRLALKRGAGRENLSLEEELLPGHALSDETAADVLSIHEALEQLEQSHPRQARVVECRFFAGLQMVETGEALGVSVNTVRRDWNLARIWLHRRLWEGKPVQ